MVFPACAGMFPVARGAVTLPVKFSPRARGCSDLLDPMDIWHTVFPACAGMFQAKWEKQVSELRFPRVRGDVPVEALTPLP